MFSLDRFRLFRVPVRLDQQLNRYSPMILTTVIALVIYHGIQLIQLSNGGTDLIDADIPKSLMLLNGQDPYSTQPWASPYPPLLLLVDSAIIRLTSLITAQTSIDSISQNLRTVGLFANAIVALVIYRQVKTKTGNTLTTLLSSTLFVTLPALSTSPLYFFHSDTFGYPILALSLVALASHRTLIGTTLLATATIFKIHPILALPLLLVWIARTKTLRKTLGCLISGVMVLGLGLLLPLALPGYATSVLGFNLSNNGNGTTLTSLIGIANNILPLQLQTTPSTLYLDQVWISATLALYTIILGTVWIRTERLQPIDVVLLGLLAWLIPLKIEYTHYVAWAIIPVLMRGQLRQSIMVLGILQLADAMSYWAWWPSLSPIPGIDSFSGLVATSAIYRILGLTALGFVIYSTMRARRVSEVEIASAQDNSVEEPYPGLESPLRVSGQ